jgi:hypothetical protein
MVDVPDQLPQVVDNPTELEHARVAE